MEFLRQDIPHSSSSKITKYPVYVPIRPIPVHVSTCRVQAHRLGRVSPVPRCQRTSLLSLCAIRRPSSSPYSSSRFAIPSPNPPSPHILDGGCVHTAPIKPSSLLLVHLPPPPPHGDLVLNGVDAVADRGENDEQNDDDDCDDDVALDHGCDVGWLR